MPLLIKLLGWSALGYGVLNTIAWFLHYRPIKAETLAATGSWGGAERAGALLRLIVYVVVFFLGTWLCGWWE